MAKGVPASLIRGDGFLQSREGYSHFLFGEMEGKATDVPI